jgi:hypothetical protein
MQKFMARRRRGKRGWRGGRKSWKRRASGGNIREGRRKEKGGPTKDAKMQKLLARRRGKMGMERREKELEKEGRQVKKT